jgi:hypothetical protein
MVLLSGCMVGPVRLDVSALGVELLFKQNRHPSTPADSVEYWIMHLRSVTQGAKLQLGPSGMSVKLSK